MGQRDQFYANGHVHRSGALAPVPGSSEREKKCVDKYSIRLRSLMKYFPIYSIFREILVKMQAPKTSLSYREVLLIQNK